MSENDKTETPTNRDSPRAERTPDGHYVIIDGRKWRATNPNLPEAERQELVNQLMKARRDVGAAVKAGDKAAEENARARVHAAKVGLGERGPKWWDENGDGDKMDKTNKVAD